MIVGNNGDEQAADDDNREAGSCAVITGGYQHVHLLLFKVHQAHIGLRLLRLSRGLDEKIGRHDDKNNKPGFSCET